MRGGMVGCKVIVRMYIHSCLDCADKHRIMLQDSPALHISQQLFWEAYVWL